MASEAKLLTVQFLKWVAERPRSYAELRDAWSSTCPLNCAWEDAIADDLVERGAEGSLVLTARGRARRFTGCHFAALIGEKGGVSCLPGFDRCRAAAGAPPLKETCP